MLDILCCHHIQKTKLNNERLVESMMGLRLSQGNLRLVFRLFSLIRALPSAVINHSLPCLFDCEMGFFPLWNDAKYMYIYSNLRI